jgi:hypothetical protein
MDRIGAALVRIDAALDEVERADDPADTIAALRVVVTEQADAIRLLAQRIDRLCVT